MTKRRDKGSGSIYRDIQRGGFKGEIVLDDKRFVRRGRSKSEVVDKLNQLRRQQLSGTLSSDSTTTVTALLDHYVQRVVPNRKGGNLSPTTLYRYRWAAERITDQIGRKRISALKVGDVEKMLDRLAEGPHGLSRDSLKRVHDLLKAALANAVKRGDVARNVAELAELPGVIRPERKRYSLSREMINRLITACSEHRVGAMFATQIFLALRPGEVAALYWSDIDFDARTINITRGRLTDDRGRSSIKDDLKTNQSKRTLDAPELLLEILKTHHHNQRVERVAAPTWANENLVFTTTVGSVIEPRAARRYLDEFCTDLGIFVEADEGLRPPKPYELRHSASSLYADEGIALEQIADLMGLASTRMIESRYRHRLRPTVSVATDAQIGRNLAE